MVCDSLCVLPRFLYWEYTPQINVFFRYDGNDMIKRLCIFVSLLEIKGAEQQYVPWLCKHYCGIMYSIGAGQGS